MMCCSDDRLEWEKLQSEMEAFQAQFPVLLARYPGQYVALNEGQVIDHDSDLRTLHGRVHVRMGSVPVLLQKVTEAPAPDILFHDVVGVSYVKGYVLTVRFDDGFERTIDFEPILFGPMFGPLRDLHLFRQARVDADLGTIVWPTGADIDPGVLYDWPEHVDAIAARRRARWLAQEAVVEG